MNGRRIMTTATTLAVALTIGGGSHALAGGQVASKVTLKVKNGAKFHGRVSSSADDCVVGRKVQIYRKEGGGDTTKVTKTFASESGKYSVKIPMQSGNKLFARIKQYNPPLKTDCGPDHSKTVTA